MSKYRASATFALVSIGWVFFRAASFGDSVHVITSMFSGPRGSLLFEYWQLCLVGIALLLAILEEKKGWFERLVTAPAWAYASAVALLLLIGVTEVAVPFVYFQF